MIWQRLWFRRSDRVFSHVLVALALVATAVVTVVAARAGFLVAVGAAAGGIAVLPLLGLQHRLRHALGSARRGDDLLLWLEQHGGSYDFEERRVDEAAFDIGRVLWRLGVATDTTVTDAVRRTDGAFAFVAHHDAVEQVVVVPTPYLPTVTVDARRDNSRGERLVRTRVCGHRVATDDPAFASLFTDAAALAHIESRGLGRVTLADGFLIARGPRFVDAQGFDERVRDLRYLLQNLPKGAVQRFSREEELVTRLWTPVT